MWVRVPPWLRKKGDLRIAFFFGGIMQIINTKRHDFYFALRCGWCEQKSIFHAVAWQVPEDTLSGMFSNHYDWCRCTVCLQTMDMITGDCIDNQTARKIIGSIPNKVGVIKFVR